MADVYFLGAAACLLTGGFICFISGTRAACGGGGGGSDSVEAADSSLSEKFLFDESRHKLSPGSKRLLA